MKTKEAETRQTKENQKTGPVETKEAETRQTKENQKTGPVKNKGSRDKTDRGESEDRPS